MHVKKIKLLIAYDWFYPGFMAGGPIQSLTNLAIALQSQFDIYVLTSGFDLNADTPYPGITLNNWSTVRLSQTEESIKVFYAGRAFLNKTKVQVLLSDIAPEVVYLNGIFSFRYFMCPLLATQKKEGVRIVVCPRGMLKKGALSSKALKKKLYIRYLKMRSILHRVYWHATTVEEALDISLHFPVNKGVLVAPNIPKVPNDTVSFIPKEPGQIRLVYLSLINEHKNLLLLLQIIKQLPAGVSLDIYGPVIEQGYWERCKEKLAEIGNRVSYKGLVNPRDVQDVFQQYHAFILLTKGENFGHAIFESLSVGRPVITSLFTPWKNLYDLKAGINVNIDSSIHAVSSIDLFTSMKQDEFDRFCCGAHGVATRYFSNLQVNDRYNALFLHN